MGRHIQALITLLTGIAIATVFIANNSPNLPKNMHQVTARVYSGAQPEAGQFAALKELGVTTAVSVDGAQPEVEAARAAGLRYVHIPVGYDGIALEEQAAFARVLREADGLVFVHCHHGQHRGPAMAALAILLEEPDGGVERAMAYLHEAGTSLEYPGLWRCVQEFDAVRIAGITPELHEVSPVSPLAEEMSYIDGHFDALTRLEENGWSPLADTPDLDAVPEALQLHERLKELLRTEVGRPDEFTVKMEGAVASTGALLEGLRQVNVLPQLMQNVHADCRSCHVAYRN
jgi:protein tyrosine phosphatase (PTP) superfamily phosphohydrolase (DUF442 family)